MAPTMTLAGGVAPRKVGDEAKDGGALIVDHPYNHELTRFAVAENGVVTWAGNLTEFCAFIRSAARSATQVAEVA